MHFPGIEPPPRYFTPEEANALLPRLRALMTKVTESGRRIREHLLRLESDERSANEQVSKEVERLREEAGIATAEIKSLGVEVKGVETGLLDFPALRNGEQVFLCWREGEARVEWWHPLSTGFAGRQRVTTQGVRWEWRN